MEERKRRLKELKKLPIFLIVGLILFFVTIGIFSKRALAANAPAIITYQGKLLISSRLATTTQNMYFILYDSASGGTALYSASGTVGTPQPVSITPNQGLFSVNLGDTGTNALSEGIFQNNTSVYLEVRIGSDTLSPRKQITAAPYAFNARFLDGVGVNSVSSTVYIPKSDANGNFVFNSTTITTSTITRLNVLSKFGINSSSPIASLALQGISGTNLLDIVSSTGASILRILTNGKIGINSSSPIDILSVQGGFQVVGGVTSTNLNVSTLANINQLGINSSSPIASLAVQGVGSLNPFSINSSTGATLVKILTNGNVGIGTSTPSQKLSVSGNISNIIDSGTSISQIGTANISMAGPYGIFVSGQYAYITDFTSSTLSVVDISKPTAPVEIATTSVGTQPFGIYVSGHYAYVVNMDVIDSQSGYCCGTMSVVDISNPHAPIQVATTSVGSRPDSIYVSGHYAYITSDDQDNIDVVDISNPLTPIMVASSTVVDPAHPDENPFSVVVSGRYAYAANGVGDSLSVFDISDPIHIYQVATTSVGTPGGQPEGMAVSGRYAYVVTQGSSILSVVDISNPSAPHQVATTSIPGTPQGVFISGRYLYTGLYDASALAIVDISNPLAPVEIATTSLGSGAGGSSFVFVSGRYAYVPNPNDNTLSVVDISGAEVTSILAHSAEVGNLQSRNDIFAQGNIMAGTSLIVGYGGIMSQGSLSVNASSTGPSSTIVDVSSAQTRNILKVFANGRIGVGTSTPISKLTIQGTGSENPFSIVSSTAAASSMFTVLTNGSIGINTSSPIASLALQGTSGINPFSINSSTGAALLNVLTNGDVGIGTVPNATISSVLQIASGAQIGNDTFSSTFLNLAGNVLVSANNDVLLETALTSKGLDLKQSGVVGINTTTPQSRLTIVGAGTENPFSIVSSTAAATSMFTVLTNGNIGINTSSPQYKLSVNGSSYFSQTSTFGGNVSNLIDSNTVISQVGTASVGTVPSSIFISGRYAYVANSNSNTISIVDVSNPSAPVQISTTSVGASPQSIFVSGRYAYTANFTDNNISIVDISNPKFPVQISTTSVGGGSPRSIYVSGRYAYVAASGGNSVVVVDISNPLAPTQIASASVGSNPRSIYVSGRYAYTANNTSNNISIIDISNPSAPVQIASTTVGKNPRSIYVSGRYAYVGNFTSNTISVVDISNPSAPIQVATTSVGNGPQAIYVSGRYAYVTNFNSNTISVVDISSSTAPIQVATTSVGSNPYGIFVSGRYLYTTNEGSNDISIVDISGTEVTSLIANSAEVGNLQSRNDIIANGNIFANTGLMVGAGGIMSNGSLSVFASSTGATSTILDISSAQAPNILKVLANGNVGIGTSSPSEKLQVIGNISNIIGSSTPIVQVATAKVGVRPHGVFVSGKYAYVTNATDGTISVVDISNPLSPVQIATTSVGAFPMGIFVSGRYAYVANGDSNSMSVVDISTPAAPKQVATVDVSSNGTDPKSIYVSGHYVYMANAVSAYISIIDIANPLAPVVVSSIIGPQGNADSIYVSGRYLYETNSGDDTISIFDISDPTQPSFVNTAAVGDNPQAIYVSGRYAYTANSNDFTISIIDISNPLTAVQVATTSVGATVPQAIYVSGRYAYVASNDSTVSVIDVYSTSSPRLLANISIAANPLAIFVSGRYAYTANDGDNNMSVIDISGTEVSSLIAHSAEIGNLQVRNDIFAQGNIMAGTSLMVGAGGIMSSGGLTVFASSTGSTSTIFSVNSARVPNILTATGFGNVGIGTSTPTEKLSVVGNISNIIDPSTTISQVGVVTLGTNPEGLFVSGRYAYVTNLNDSNISVVDVSNPTAPAQISTTSVGSRPEAIYVSGRYAYTADHNSNTISVVDISNPKAPKQVATAAVGSGPQAIYVSGRYAYVANESASSVSIVDIANPLHPVQIATTSVDAQPYSIAVSGRYAYTANFNAADISVIDVSNPSRPVQIATTSVGFFGNNPSAIYVSGRYAYTANNADGTMSVVDISNPAAPFEVATTTVGSAPWGIYVSGRYAYLSRTGTLNSISVVDISNPLAPSLVASGSTTGNDPQTIFISGRYAYTANSGNNNMSVIDISGTEVSSLLAGSAEIGNIQSRNDIFAQGNIIAGTGLMVGAGGIMSNGSLTVFASTTGATSSIFDISSAQTSNILKVFANGNIGIGTSTPSQRLSVVGNISNILDPSNTGAISQIATTSAGINPYGIFVSGRYAYVANQTSNNMSVLDISNPSAPVQITSTTVGTNPISVFVSGRYAYVTNYLSANISVVDISNPSAPKQIATASVGTNPFGIFVSGRYAYVANDVSNSISVVDISNPLAPIQIATTSVGMKPRGIFVSGRYAYVTNYTSNTISVVDVSNPSLPTQIATTSVGTSPNAIYVSGRYAYVANYGSANISIVDISNPAAPTKSGTSTVATNPSGIYVSGRYAYVTNEGSNSISIIDISSSTAPSQITTVSVGTTPEDVYVSGRYAYVTNGASAGSISVVDISGTEVSSLLAGSAEVGNLQSRNDIFAQGNIIAGTGLMVGAGGIMSNGSLTVFASTTGANSSIFDISSAQTSNILKVFANGNIGIGTSTPSEKLQVVGNISNIIGASTTISQIATAAVGAGPLGIFVSGRYAYVANSISGTVSVVDLSNSTAPVQISTTTAAMTFPSGVYVYGHYVYVVDSSTSQIIIFDIANQRVPARTAKLTISGSPNSVYISGRYAYTTSFASSTITITDVSNPINPVQVATTSVGYGPKSIYVSGRFAYTANNTSNTISVIDISNPFAPIQIATTSVGYGPTSIYVSGRYAYVTNFTSNTISVVDISSSSLPIQVATTSVGTGPTSIYVSGRYAYVTNSSSNNVSIVDVSVPTTPIQVSTVNVGTGPASIYVSGRYAYVANNNSNNISVVDISGTEVTSLMAHSAEVGNLQSRNDIFAQGNIMAGTSLSVGYGGIMSQGTLSIFASSTGANSSIFDISSFQTTNILKVFASGTVMIGTSTPTGYRLFVDAGATTSAGIGVNGYVKASGFIAGTSSLDLAELYPVDPSCAQNGNCPQTGDVVCSVSDGGSGFYITKCSSAYAENSIGVVSGDPGFTLGGLDPEGNAFKPVALAGRVPIKVSNANGDIHIGDRLAASDVPGVAMKATGEGKTIAMAMGDYTSSDVGTVTSFVNVGWNNTLHNALTVDTNAKTLTVGSSSNPYNIVVNGNLSFASTDVVNKLSFATSTLFESNVGSFSGARAFIFNALNFSSSSADNYLISVRSNNTPVFSVTANGDVQAKGNYYGASAVLGTSTNPGDLAERVDIAIDDTVEAGDVMVVDKNSPDTYRRSSLAYEQSVAGIISTNPTIVVGNGKTDYTAVMAMVGRVPVKVSNENGNIERGDLLITAATPGFAMKYDPAKDKDNKMVAVIGVALESSSASSSKVLALIRTGWVYNRDQAIDKLQTNIQQIAAAQGIDLASSSDPGNLNVASTNGQLTYTGGNLDLQNNSIINVATIIGRDNKWRIDESGNLIQKIATAIGDKETYSLQSSDKQDFVISGTSTLENGSKKIILTDLDQAIIDKTVPLKIQITPAGETKGVYVSERSFDSFVVKENDNGTSNAAFDWTVIAKVLSPDTTTSGPDSSSGGSQTGQSNSGSGEQPLVSGSDSGPVTTSTPSDSGSSGASSTVSTDTSVSSSTPDAPITQ